MIKYYYTYYNYIKLFHQYNNIIQLAYMHVWGLARKADMKIERAGLSRCALHSRRVVWLCEQHKVVSAHALIYLLGLYKISKLGHLSI